MERRGGPNRLFRNRLTSSDHQKKISSIVCLNIPPQFLDKANCKAHFSKYGKVIKISVSTVKNSASVLFDSHESALQAKQNGNQEFPDMKIFLSQFPRKSLDSDTSPPKKPSVSSEVEEELKSMSQQGGYFLGRRDQPSSPLRKTKLDNVFQRQERPKPPGGSRSDKFASKTFGNVFGGKQPQSSQRAADKPPSLFQPIDKSRYNFVAPKKDFFAFPGTAHHQPPAETSKPAKLPSQGLFQSADAKFSSRVESPPLTQLAPAKPPPAQNSAQRAALQAAVKKRAQNNEDIVAILEARDKLLRLKMNRSAILATAVKTIGTCEDMCPERERYLRMERHQVNHYETRNGQMDHRFFVKEYSRSSADQELPLPHDLRPSPVLRRTMDYLLYAIASRVDLQGESLGDWFLFMWDRTRAIRKEVTQQELCNEDSVILLEQCARFHIACAARLAEEDVHSFDPKINSENLAKCLQTLKHLYHDMALLGKTCPNEAEFRAYIVLLNLNTGDAIWEVQQLGPQVLASLPVQFAIKIYLALNTNNYVSFFKMVRQIGYLPGAILMRYFTQVRTKALEVLIRAYCQSLKSQYLFPVADLERVLGFEDTAAAAEFCQYHGLDTTAEIVTLSKTTFMMPESAIPNRRAKLLVESQLGASFAEVIAGYQLHQQYAEPPPATNSFDSSTNMLTAEILQDLEDKGAPAPAATSNITLSKNIFSTQSLFSQQSQLAASNFSRTASSIFGQTAAQQHMIPAKPQLGTHTQQQQISQLSLSTYQKLAAAAVPQMVNEISSFVLKDMKLTKSAQLVAKILYPRAIGEVMRDVLASELAEAKREEQYRKFALQEKQRREKQRQDLIAMMSTQWVQQILEMAVHEEVTNLATAKLAKEKMLAKLAKETCKEIISDTLESVVTQEVGRELKEAKELWRKKVQELCDKLLCCRARRMLLKWRDTVKMIMERRERLQRFPALRSSLSNADQIEALSVVSPSRKGVYSGSRTIKTVTDIRTSGTQTSMPLVSYEQVSLLLKSSLNAPAFLLGNCNMTQHIWRLVVSVPPGDKKLQSWADLCFTGGCLSSSEGTTSFFSNGVIVEVEIASTDPSCPDPHALVLVVQDQEEAVSRLEQMFFGNFPTAIALLMVDGKPIGETLRDALHKICAFQGICKVKAFELVDLSPSKAQFGLDWLVMSSRTVVDSYVISPLKDILLSIMQLSTWQTILMASGPKSHEELQSLQMNPDLCIKIANAALKHLSVLVEDCITNISREEESFFELVCADLPPYWNDPLFRRKIAMIIEQLTLPKLNLEEHTLKTSNWSKILETYERFCNHLPLAASQSSAIFSWVSLQILSHQYQPPSDPMWANILASLLKEFVSAKKLDNPVSSSSAPLVIILSFKQIETLLTCDWCPKSLLQELGRKGDPVEENNVAAKKTSYEQSACGSLQDKLQSLLLGLAESKAKRQKIEDTVTEDL